MADPVDAERTAILIECEGSGCPAHRVLGGTTDGVGICAMCGRSVATNCGIALLHTRQDIIAMLDRGDFGDAAAAS